MTELEVYDIECLQNIFTFTSYNCSTKKWYQYVISNWRNDFNQLIDHLALRDIIQVGYNNENFDYPILHSIINNRQLYSYFSGDEIAREIYKYAQELIKSTDIVSIKSSEKYIKQIDLYKMWNFDSMKISLKEIEVHLRMDNVEDMPIPHWKWCTPDDENILLEYNKNDVEATYQLLLTTLGKTENILYKNKNKIQLRLDLQKQFKVNCMNLSDSRLGERLLLYTYAKATNSNVYDVKKLSTHRSQINLQECIPKWNNVNNGIFYPFIEALNKTIITLPAEDDVFKLSIVNNNFKWNFSLGACHGCVNSGTYTSDKDNVIMDIDVNSLFPSIVKSLNLYPKHLGEKFNELYSHLVTIRLTEKEKPINEQNKTVVEGFKKALNAAIGKSNEEKSFLYDPFFSYSVRIAGQVFIAMWCNSLITNIPDIKFLMVNTDGITISVNRDHVSIVDAICEDLTRKTQLTFSKQIYNKIFIKDVSNYLAVCEDGSIKDKGEFEINKEFHKDPSARIVPIAVKEYFVNNIPIEETITNHKDIFDFCIRLKSNASTRIVFKHLDDSSNIVEDDMPKTIRYYMSNGSKTGSLFKKGEASQQCINYGFSVNIFNKYIKYDDFKDYHINYSYYIKEANRLKHSITNGQLTLF